MCRITWRVIVGALCVTYAVGHAQEWQWQHGRGLVTQVSLDWVQALDTSTVWAVGDSGAILRTTDGGSTWIRHESGTTRRLWYIEFADVRHGWVCGDSGVVLRTTDGGESWSKRDTVIHGTLESISFVDTLNGWMAGSGPHGGTILHTSDGGISWTLQATVYDNLYGVDFYDTLQGIAVGSAGAALRTTNGGLTWGPSSFVGDFVYDVRFIAPNIALATGQGIFRTTSGGFSWSNVYYGNGGIYSIAFVGSKHGWVCGRFGMIAHSPDSGATWVSQQSTTESKLRGISFADTLCGWAVGDSGVMRRTRDGGLTWTDVEGGHTPDYVLNSVICDPTGVRVWAVGSHGDLLRSADGGAVWQHVITGADLNFRSIRFIDAVLWIATDVGALLRSEDNGDSWVVYQPTQAALENITFADVRHAWAAGWSGTIIATTDGGSTWQTQGSDGEQTFLFGVSFADTLHGCAVGGYGATLFTNDGGAHWQHADTLTDQTLNDVKLLPDGRGWIVGQSNTVFQSADFGATWTAVTILPDHNWRIVRVIGADTVWLVSEDGNFVRSENDGASWSTGVLAQVGGFNDVCFTADGRQGWAAGVYERILHYDAGLSTAPHEAEILPARFEMRVYPNPFNAVARLELFVPRDGKMLLNIFNVNGQLVRTLADGHVIAGTHTFSFDAEALPSGLYFAHLSGAGTALTQKLVLLK